MMLSDVCLSAAYIGPKSRTERPRKTKLGTEVGTSHVTQIHFQGQKVKGQGHRGRGHIVVASGLSSSSVHLHKTSRSLQQILDNSNPGNITCKVT